MRTLAAALGVVLLLTVPLPAQWMDVTSSSVPRHDDGSVNLEAPAPLTRDGVPDFSGLWMVDTVPCNEAAAEFGCSDIALGLPVGAIHVAATGSEDVATGRPLPYRPWAKALFEENVANEQLNSPEARCLPTLPTRQWAEFGPQKILQSGQEVVLLGEFMVQYRQIFLDGRSLPEDPFPMFKGYSTGRWDGDTLVVESAGFKGGLWLDLVGNPMTEPLRLTERIRRPTYGHLEVTITVNDPGAYTGPFTVYRHLTRWADTDLIEYACNENEKSLQRMIDSAAP